MTKLKALKPTLGGLPPLLKPQADAEGHSGEAWRNWYKRKDWLELRVRVFARDNYTCQLKATCGGQVISRPIADHRIPHRGDRRLFIDEGNVWTLCKPCHDRVKQAEEAATRRTGG